MSETLITISEASKRLGIQRNRVSAAIDVLGLPTERTPLNGNARLINLKSLATLKRKFASRPVRKAAS